MTALNQWRDVEITALKDCAQRSDPRLCKYYDVYFPPLCEDHYLTIYLQKSWVFHAFLVAMMFAVIKLVPGLFVCLYITLQCWKVLSCLLFLSRLIYLRRLWLGNCQSNIFYIVIFAQLLLREIWNGNMFYEYETIEAIWVWAHAKVYVKELEKNIIQSDTFEMGRCYFNVYIYIYYFFLQLVPHELCWSVTAVCIKNEFISAMIHLYGK